MAASVRAVFPTGTTASVAGASTTVTTSVTVVSGDSLEAHVIVSAGADSGMSVSATANGVAADGSSVAVHSNGQTAGFEQVFYWLTPSVGTYNVVATVTGGTPDDLGQKCYAVAGSNQTAPAISTFAPSGTGNNTAATITSPTMPTGSVGISHFCAGSTFSSTGQTTQLNDVIGGATAANSVAGASTAGAGSTVNFTATISAGDWYAAIVTVWAQAGGGGGGPTEDPNQAAHWLARPPGHLTPATGFPALRGKAKAPPIPPSPPFFTSWVDGVTPDLIVSAEDWGLVANAGLNHGGDFAATYTDYFSTRQGQGYNSVLVSLFGYSSLSGGVDGRDSDGTYPFTPNTDPTGTANTTFWARRDAFLSTAATYGFRVMLNVSTPNVHVGAFTASWTNAQWSALGTFLGNRYISQSNIMWMVGDDYFDDIDPGFTAFLVALRATGANQPISIQNYQETSSQRDIFSGGTRPWGDANAQYNFGYSYNASYDVVEKMGLEDGSLPYFWGDGFFLASGTTGITDVQLMRRMIWWALSSGSKGFEVGDNDIWTWSSTALAQVTAKTFYTAVVPAIAAYFRSLPSWHLLVADTTNGLVLSGRGTHTTAFAAGGTPYTSDTDSYVTAARTPTGSLAVIYMSHGSTITIDETVMVAGYTATWVDPKTCATTAGTPGTTYNSTARGNNSDGQADWVLVLKAPVLSASPSDPVGVTDSVTRVVAADRTQSDAVGVSDTAAVQVSAQRSQADPVGVTDALTLEQAKTLTDPVGVTDALALQQDRTQADPVGVTDSITAQLTGGGSLTANPSDPVGVTDALALQQDRTQTDPVGVTDAVALQQDRTLADPVGVTDTAARTVAADRQLADPVGVTDSVTADLQTSGNINLNDPVGVTDVAATALTAQKTQADPIGVTDTAAAFLTFSRASADSVGLTDAVNATLSLGASPSDPVGVTDLLVLLVNATRVPADPVSVSDQVTAVLIGSNDGVPVRNPGLTITVPISGLVLTVPTSALIFTVPASRLELT